jgi:3-oxoacyl-[acyl-carrier-protein] synthase II
MRSMKAALRSAQLGTDKIDYINAHGTSTMADTIELGAVKKVFGADVHKLSMSSTKSATGHLLGAAGAIEAIYTIKSLIEQTVPPTLNLDEPDEGCSDVDLVPHTAKTRQVRYALSNSFGFGGTNASLILGGV